ncbi:hypothetical protein BC332_12946 [Capsicum chinense]|nr:hypothetical protein BC332_12946 [Capsicum chinense]
MISFKILAGQNTDILETLTPQVRKRVDILRELQVLLFILFVSNVINLVYGEIIELINLGGKFPDVTSLIPASPNASSGLSFGRQRAKDPAMVFVSGATGQAGIGIARILLREGYSVRGGVSDLGAALELAHLAISYKIEHNWDGITLKDFILKSSVPLSMYSWIKGTMKARAYHLSCTKGARCAGRSHLKRKLDLEFQPEEE